MGLGGRGPGGLGRAAAAAVALIAVAAACTGGGGAGGAGGGALVGPPTPPPVESPAVAPASPSAEPSTTASAPVAPSGGSGADREALLVELRAGDRFLELAEADRARNATWARFGYHQFAPHEDGEVLFEWANKEELWNSIAPRIRDECLLAGPEAVYPMWDAKVVIPAHVSPVWNDESTQGRGQLVELVCTYAASGQSVLAQLWFASLISTEEGRVGRVSSIMDPIVVTEPEYSTSDEAVDATREAMWAWVWSQPADERRAP